MWPSLIVISPPPLRKFTDLFDIAEDVGIQDSPAVTAVKALHIAVLGRLPWLDVLVLDAVRLTPYVELLRDELRAVVRPDALRLAVLKITFSMIDMTRSAGIDIDISCATASLLLSSSMFRTLKVRPLSILSLTKSIDHVLFGSRGASSGSPTRLGKRFFNRLRLLKWIFLYTRYTFLWFQVYPSCRNRWKIFSNPSPYSAAARIASSTSVSSFTLS